MISAFAIAAMISLPSFAPLSDNTSRLSLVPSGAAQRLPIRPQVLQMNGQSPGNLTESPVGAGAMWARIELGPQSTATAIMVALDEEDPLNPKIYVDANADGNMTNDPEITWPKVELPEGQKQVDFRLATVEVSAGNGSTVKDRSLTLYRFGPAENRARRLPPNALLYLADFYMQGHALINGRTHPVILWDEFSTGDFTFPNGRSMRLFVGLDLNGNGEYDRAEMNPAGAAFKAGDGYLKVAAITPDGTGITFEKSAPPKPKMTGSPRVNQDARPFEGPGLDGKQVKFPDDYRGKLVLLDFWAMWCGPCVQEIPHIAEAYQKYHEKGLEVLGVSFDGPGLAERLKRFVAQRKIPWQQVYDGKKFNSPIGRLYQVRGIPSMFLVDGDTGKILAAGHALRGPNLLPRIKAAMADKFDSD